MRKQSWRNVTYSAEASVDIDVEEAVDELTVEQKKELLYDLAEELGIGVETFPLSEGRGYNHWEFNQCIAKLALAYHQLSDEDIQILKVIANKF